MCGHMAVFHHQNAAPTEMDITAKEELESLKSKVENLERLLERELEAKNTLVVRVSNLEEYNDNTKGELDSEMKAAYRGKIGRAHV